MRACHAGSGAEAVRGIDGAPWWGLRSELVLVKEPAEPVVPLQPQQVATPLRWRRFRERRSLLERAVRPVHVVVRHLLAQDSLEVLAGDDQQTVETVAPDRSHPALRVRLGLRRRDRRLNHSEALGAEHVVEAT